MASQFYTVEGGIAGSAGKPTGAACRTGAGESAPAPSAAAAAPARGEWEQDTRINGYVVAVMVTAATLFVRLLLGERANATSPLLSFAPAVMISAWYGGRGPGLFATVAGAALANYFLFGPMGFSFETGDVTRAAIFLFVGAQISWLSGALLDAKRRAESDAQAARRSEQLYRTLAQNFPNGAVFLLDDRMRVVLAEGEALVIAGVLPEQIRGRRLSSAFPRDVRTRLSPLLRSGRGGSAEITVGNRVYLVGVLPLGGTAGRQFAGMGIAQDISELVAARSELQAAHDQLEQRVRERTAELRFQTALLEAQSDASLDGILVSTHDGKLIFHNRRLCELWGLPGPVFTGARDKAVAAMRGVLAGPQDPLGGGADLDEPRAELPANLELRDGRTLECYGAPVDGADVSYGRAWYFRDVTERRRTARQILDAGERERRRIGQDLHDDLCQHLAGISCHARVLQQRLVQRNAHDADAASVIGDLADEALSKARGIARGLQPLQLETDGLPSALQGLGAEIERMFRIRCHVECPPSLPVTDPAVPMQLYRITQEAVSNAIRHGRASEVYVDLARAGDRLILSIEDNGCGIDDRYLTTTTPRKSGLGLRTMRHRAQMIGASLQIERLEGGGTAVTCAAIVCQPNALERPESSNGL